MPRSRFPGRAQAWVLAALALGLAALLVTVGTRGLRDAAVAPVVGPSPAPHDAAGNVSGPSDELEVPASVEAQPDATGREERPAAGPAPLPDDPGSQLEVSVVGPSGSPWSAPFELWLEPLALGPAGRRPAPAWHAAIGPRATLAGLPAGRARGYARARAARSASFEVELPPAGRAAVALALAGAGTVEGRLTDSAGAALEGVSLALRAAGGPLETQRTGTDGAFRFDPVLDGNHELVFGNPNAPLRAPLPVRHVGVRTDLGTVALPELASIVVEVEDASGRPVEGARVWDSELVGYLELVSDAAGICRAKLLPPGRARVFAEHAAHGRANRPVMLEAGREARVELVLPR